MNKCVFALAFLTTFNCFATVKLMMKVDKGTNYTCEISDNQVTITRKIGEIKFTKTNAVKTEGLDKVIEKAYFKGPMTEQSTEYTAVYITRNPTTNAIEEKAFNFKYGDSEFANNLVYVTSTLCEVKYL